jgi:hypothetical protein
MARTSKNEAPLPAGLKVKVTAELPDSWDPKEGDVLTGTVTSIQEVEQMGKEGLRTTHVMHVKTDKGLMGLWESATLKPLFKSIAEGERVWVRYEGLGEKKAGHSAPKLYTAGTI